MSAFRQSVEAMIPALRRYARALARDADVADDLVLAPWLPVAVYHGDR